MKFPRLDKIANTLDRPMVVRSIVCVDGTRFSVQASNSHHCSPRSNNGPWRLFEVMGYYNNGSQRQFGYVSLKTIQNRIKSHGGELSWDESFSSEDGDFYDENF